MMKRASEAEWPEAWNFWRASSSEAASVEKITWRLARPTKWKWRVCWTSFSWADIVAELAARFFGEESALTDRSSEMGCGSREMWSVITEIWACTRLEQMRRSARLTNSNDNSQPIA